MNFLISQFLNAYVIQDINLTLKEFALKFALVLTKFQILMAVFVLLALLETLLEIVFKFHAQLMNIFLMEFVPVFQDFSEILKDYVKKAVIQMNFLLMINVIVLKTMSEILMESVFISLQLVELMKFLIIMFVNVNLAMLEALIMFVLSV
jgi:hypothetical protein